MNWACVLFLRYGLGRNAAKYGVMHKFLILLVGLAAASLAAAEEQVLIRMMGGGGYGIPPKEATNPRQVARRAVFERFHLENPDIRVVNAGGLELTGDRAESMFLMSMAGSAPPDVFYVNFRQYYNYIDQGFCRPLDDLLQREPGLFKNINPMVKQVLTSYNGRIYAVPWFQVALGLYYRRDHFREAGLDPNKPPRTWDEFLSYARILTEKSNGRTGFGISNKSGYHWSNFVYQAGGQIVTTESGGRTRAVLDNPGAAQALDFFRKLAVEQWKGADGKTYGPATQLSTDWVGDIRTGKVSMWFDYTGDVVMNMTNTDVPPQVLGLASLPAGPAGASHEINAGMWAINSNVKDPKKLDACLRFIKFFAGDRAAEVNTQRFVELGMGNLVNPQWLKKFGYEELLSLVDPRYVEANRDLFRSGHPEPYGRNTQQVYSVLDNALDRARLEPRTPAREILKEAQQEMDQKLLGFIPDSVMQVRRAWATGIATALVFGCLAFGGVAAKRRIQQIKDEEKENVSKRKAPPFFFFALVPAVATLLIWAYYPLGQGLLIAFQDYRIMKGSTWVGLDNFINVFSQPIFWRALVNSFAFVGLSIGIGFLIPIFLAVMLNEIPRAKTFFRTLYYLPAMTSGIVIALLWRQFYDKTDSGLMNIIVAPFVHVVNFFIQDPAQRWPLTYDWLGSPQLAMFAVVLPGVWAGAGPGSILYLAALKNIPDERYEAADIDGANWVQKLTRITLPGLKPLILINLLGVFVGGFKAMESIFVLTRGGPMNATQTIGLEIWTNAFMFLKFGYATAAAWVMGSILIGFTIVQIRSLLTMRFTTSKVTE